MVAKLKAFVARYGEVPSICQFCGDRTQVDGWDVANVPSRHTICTHFGSWGKFVEAAGFKAKGISWAAGITGKKDRSYTNIPLSKKSQSLSVKIIADYLPTVQLLPNTFKAVPRIDAKSNGLGRLGMMNGFKNHCDKDKLRTKILSQIKDGDSVLLLESPALLALQEIQKLGIKPKEIIIPNHIEFAKVAAALREFKTDLNITLVHASALQYLVDTDIKFDFMWLDYCGAFCYYQRDLEIIMQKLNKSLTLVLTYNLWKFDKTASDDVYYFAQVANFIQKNARVSGKEAEFIENVSSHYKKRFYTVGFRIGEREAIKCSTN